MSKLKIAKMTFVRGTSTAATVAAVAIWCALSIALARDDDLSPQYSECVDKSGGVTAELVDCHESEFQRQDDKLNKSYRALLAKLAPQRRRELVKAQRAWISFRDANCGFIYSQGGAGSASRLNGSGCIINTTAERARELKDMLEAEGD